jgi:hypothetical protein
MARPTVPSVVVGIGDFGRQVVGLLKLVTGSRSGLSRLVTLWTGVDGWYVDSTESLEADLQETGNIDVNQWLEMHATTGRKLLQQSILEAVSIPSTNGRPNKDESKTLHLYLVVHLNEATGRTLWQPVLDLMRAANVPFGDHIFTLIVATDSLSFHHFKADDAQELLDALETLSDELVAVADEYEESGRIGWCYLLDTVDMDGRPLHRAKEKRNEENGILADPLSLGSTEDLGLEKPRWLQAHQATEFIALLCAGLGGTPAYQRTSLSHLRRDFRAGKPVAWVSAFGAGSAVFPVAALLERARELLTHRLLVDYILGKDRPGDLPAARRLRDRWLTNCTLEPDGVRRRIMRDAAGYPITFPVEPPLVENVPDERLVDHLLNWDTILWQRWRRPDGPPARLGQSATALAQEAVTWLKSELDLLLERELGGIRRASLFVAEVEKAVEDARLQANGQPSTDSHWLTALLAALRLPYRDPTALPDMDKSRRRLEAALLGRLNRRAVWVRASLFGATLLSFVWAAYLAAGQVLGLRGLVSRWLNRVPAHGVDPLVTVDLLVLAAGCWFLALVVSALYLYWRESAIHRATDRMIIDISRKYRALMKRALREQRDRMYGSLSAETVRWREAIAARRDMLLSGQQKLEEAMAEISDALPLATETSLLPLERWSAWLPHYEPLDCRRLAGRFLNDSRRRAWPQQTGVEFVAALRAFAAAELAEWSQSLRLNSWADLDGNSRSLNAVLQGLRETVRPAWPLNREERSQVLARAERPLSPDRHRHTASAVVTHWLGTPAHGGQQDPALAIAPKEEAFSTHDSVRLAYVVTVHALELQRLHIWQSVRHAALNRAASIPALLEVEVGSDEVEEVIGPNTTVPSIAGEE